MQIRYLSISHKMIVSLILFLITPLLFTAFFLNSRASNVIDNKTHELIYQTLKQTETNFTQMINDTEFLSVAMLADKNLQEMTIYYLNKSYLNAERFRRELFFSFDSLIKSRPYIHSISLSDGDEVIYQYGKVVTNEDTTFHKRAADLKGRSFWTPTYPLHHLATSGKDPTNVISIIRAVNDLNKNNHILATLRISIDETYLYQLFKDINRWEEGSISIIDQFGNIISSTDRTLPGKSPSEYPFANFVDTVNEGYSHFSIDGRTWSGFSYSIPEVGWKVIQFVPSSELRNETKLLNMYVAISIGFSVFLGLIFYLMQKKSIINPLRKLSMEMAKVKAGHFKVNLPSNANDEIGRISQSFIDMVYRIEDLIEKEYSSIVKEKEAKLSALESQINPHFLYNTLESIRWQAIKSKEMIIADQIEALANIFRHVLNMGHSHTTIKEEVNYLQNYMLIQSHRYGDKISMSVQTDPRVLLCATPKLLLQPLVENAIKHGLEPQKGKGQIEVRIEQRGESICYSVSDNGVGMDQSVIVAIMNQQRTDKSYALRNIIERIQLYYGEPYGMHITSEPGHGTIVEINIPFQSQNGGML